MRKTIFSALVLLLLISGFILIKPETENRQISPPPSPPPAPGTTDKFLIGAVQSYYDIMAHNNYHDSAGFNTTHIYIGGDSNQIQGNPTRHTPQGNISEIDNDHLFSPVNTVKIKKVVNDMYNLHNHSRFLWMRPKIEWLCYGQSSIYKAVQSNDDYWFYAFNVRKGSLFPDNQWNNGVTVLDCSDISLGPNAQYVLQRLKANTEQCRRTKVTDGNNWQGDSECDWLIKPRIRIDSNFAHNTQNPLVCKIKVIAQDLTVLKDVDIHANDFLDGFGHYNGRYLEEFNFTGNTDLTIHGDWGNWPWYSARGNATIDTTNKADVQVYWYDNCEMWIDYVKVENDVASDLLSTDPNNNTHQIYNQWITDEVNAVKDPPTGASETAIYNFYIELFEFNNIPCMAYVNNKIKSLTGGKIGLMADLLTFYEYHMPISERGSIVTPEKIKRMFFDVTGFNQVFIGDPYPLTAAYSTSCYPCSSNQQNPQFSQIPNTLPFTVSTTNGGQVMAVPTSPPTYDAWLQGHLDTICTLYEAGDLYFDHCPIENTGNFRFLMKHGNQMSKLCNIPFIAMLQAHQWMSSYEVDREPTNEELNLMSNIAVSYGAKGIIYWEFPSEYRNGCDYGKGLLELAGTPRLFNVYGEAKWDNFKQITGRLKTWGPYLMSFDNTQTNSYILRLDWSSLTASSYFSDVLTYTSDITHPGTATSFPEPVVSRFMQAATFQNSSEPLSNYFMLVNKRCSPIDPNYNDGRRDVRVQLKASQLTGFNNWKIINLYDYSTAATFDKNANTAIDLGWFNPGEGRLYKLAPVMQEGGTLVVDESFGGILFTCNGKVYNNNKNITITGNTSTISFADTATIIMSGGTFQSSSASSGPIQQKNNFKGLNGKRWNGLQFTGSYVNIYNSNFQDISSANTYAVNSINCPLNDIRYNTFTSNTDTAGGVSVIYSSSTTRGINTYIKNNSFSQTNNYASAVRIQAFAGFIAGTYIENNTLASNGNDIGLLISTVSSGSIRNNTITNFATGINATFCTIDVFGNTISNSAGVSDGIFAAASSNINLSPNGGLYTGGFNTITSTSGLSKNIEVNKSVFNIFKGQNTFDVLSSFPVQTFHLFGLFWRGAYTTQAQNNCFKIGGVAIADPTLPNSNVVDYLNNQITFTFLPYMCNGIPPSGRTIVSIGNGLYDTIPTSGMGGGFSSVSDAPAPKALYDSLKIQMLYRNYNSAKNLCYNLINTYPDSMQSTASLQTLYMASTAADTSTASVTALKTFYENLILNHGNNIAMVKISNYLVQKCKVLLRQYSSAMAGFQQIINNNQYNYEGLLARWDYMATSLLMNGGGGGNGMSDFLPAPGLRQAGGLEISDLKDEKSPVLRTPPLEGGILTDDEFDKFDDDKSPFTKEERKIIKETLTKTNGINKNIDEVKVQILQKRSDEGDAIAGKELKTMKILKDVIKTERPKDIFEHMRIVNADIQKVFGSGDVNSNGVHNLIPSVFMLHQNYPNPFNPSATIKYDLPKDSKVTIKIYDIIGREVRILVNEFMKAGYYQAIFDGTNLASGVYFYRIEAGDFVDSKKMVLIK